LHGGFTFADLRQIAPYLSSLGITDCYCSPPFTARPGSTHGYDITNHNELSPELGGWASFRQMAESLAHLGMGLILDFVPNHMGNDPRTNVWWRDVLENGPSSPFARVFDIDWDPLKPELKNRLLVPILGEPYGQALEQGLLQLGFDDGALVLRYHDHHLPINPRRGRLVFEFGLDSLTAELGQDHRQLREFLSVLTALRNLPPYTVREAVLVTERTREKEITRERQARLVAESEPVRRHIDRALAAINGVPGDPHSFDALHELLEQQVYRLAHWRTAADEINYRRFFDINDLAGLRVEDDRVFAHIHELVLQLIAEGTVTGLRLDHIDGLADPAAYLDRLQAAIRAARADRDGGEDGVPFYVIVEKILSGDERLPDEWATAGTTGYSFLNDVNGLFVERRHERRMLRTYQRLTGQGAPLADIVYDCKRVIIGTALSSEFQVLASAVNRLSEDDRKTRDFTFGSIRRALREVVACFPVYRTYASERGVSDADHAGLRAAIVAARLRNPATEPSIFAFLEQLMLGTGASPEAPDASTQARRLEVVRKFQQYTAPVQAKGLEDTAFYRHNLLLSLNEVGGDPDRFGRSVDEFHAANAHRRAQWPLDMTTTATHDTKRGEDARARLNVLSEIPGEWRDAVTMWMRINGSARRRVAQRHAPDRNDEYHYYQALLAIWPPESESEPVPGAAPDAVVERLQGYMVKAVREAKRHSSWVNPNGAYETAVSAFVETTLRGGTATAFLRSFVPVARRVSRIGSVNSLAQLVLKLVSPGVPDFYQGSELWDLTLVDPDNRGAVDYQRRRAWLSEMEPRLTRLLDPPAESRPAEVPPYWTTGWTDGRVKLFVTAVGLRLRRAMAELFHQGSYEVPEVAGRHRDHVVACGRAHGSQHVVAVVPRLVEALPGAPDRPGPSADAWQDTRLRLPAAWHGRAWHHALSGEMIPVIRGHDEEWWMVSKVLGTCPVAMLRSLPASSPR
jgi:(1->4)-alpha-D-glucan 1-alpha-D-glucosylmutase